jgi:hypothetical protein
MSFTEPTPFALAGALQASSYGYDAHGVSVVVAGDVASVSATLADEQGMHRFTPTAAAAPIVRDQGGFRMLEPQASGWLRLDAAGDPVELPMRNVTIDARAHDDCGQILVVLDAVLPVEAGSEAIFDGQAWRTVAELAPDDEGLEGWPIRALFQGEPVTFDFAGGSP